MLEPGALYDSPGGSFCYRIEGPVCRLYDREELPWPCCRLSWRGKEPSWRRIGPRLVGDLACRRFPSYAVTGFDRYGNSWQQVATDFTTPLRPEVARWWYAKTPAPGADWPAAPEGLFDHP
ncbi:hypothetical protein [Vulcanococcus sp.]|uniref:hypothetical protein n=1 Tax=Vulcanococcus sp. TaxID=2856995 RepID=UPI003C129FCA